MHFLKIDCPEPLLTHNFIKMTWLKISGEIQEIFHVLYWPLHSFWPQSLGFCTVLCRPWHNQKPFEATAATNTLLWLPEVVERYALPVGPRPHLPSKDLRHMAGLYSLLTQPFETTSVSHVTPLTSGGMLAGMLVSRHLLGPHPHTCQQKYVWTVCTAQAIGTICACLPCDSSVLYWLLGTTHQQRSIWVLYRYIHVHMYVCWAVCTIYWNCTLTCEVWWLMI